MGKTETLVESSMNEHQHAAISAAQRGDWSKADFMELEYLNAKRFQLFPNIELDRMPVAKRARLRATTLIRGLAPGGQIGVRWTVATRQAEEEGDYTYAEVFFTDIDGNLIEVDRTWNSRGGRGSGRGGRDGGMGGRKKEASRDHSQVLEMRK